MAVSLKDLYEKGRHKEVIEAAAGLSIHPTNDPISSLFVAASLLQLGHLHQCQQICVTLEPAMAANPQYLSLYGSCLRRLGDYQKSEKLFKYGLEQFPDLPYLNNNYANLLIEQGEIARARQLLESVLARHPEYADAKINLQRIESLPTGSVSVPEAPPEQRLKSAARDPRQHTDETLAVDRSSEVEISLSAKPAPSPASVASEPQTKDQSSPFVDPLDLAFSEEEVEVEQRERRQRKSEVASRQAPLEPKGWPPLPDLPPVPPDEFHEELAKAGSEALIEKQPMAALVLADLLNDFGTEPRREAMKIAADAYLMLKRYPRAEITLLSLMESGTKLGIDQILNIVGLALKRKDVEQACHFLAQARKIDPQSPRLEKLSTQLDAMKQGKSRLTFHPYDGSP